MKLLRHIFFALLAASLTQVAAAQILVSGTSPVVVGSAVVKSILAGGGPVSLGLHTENNGFIGSASTLTTPTGTNCTTGSTLVAFSISNGAYNATGSSIADSPGGNTYTHLVTDLASSGGAQKFNVWIAQNATGGSNCTVTLHAPTATGLNETSLQFVEVKGTATSSLDQQAATAANVSGSGTSYASPTITPGQANEMILALYGMGIGSATVFSAPTNGFTLGDQSYYGTSITSAYAYLIDSGTSSISTTLTMTGASGFGYSAFILSLIP